MPVPGSRGLAAFARKARTPARNWASWGVFSQPMLTLSERCVRRLQLRDQALLPHPGAAKRQRQELGPPIVQVTIELPGVAQAAVHLDVLLRRQEIGIVGRN